MKEINPRKPQKKDWVGQKMTGYLQPKKARGDLLVVYKKTVNQILPTNLNYLKINRRIVITSQLALTQV